MHSVMCLRVCLKVPSHLTAKGAGQVFEMGLTPGDQEAADFRDKGFDGC